MSTLAESTTCDPLNIQIPLAPSSSCNSSAESGLSSLSPSSPSILSSIHKSLSTSSLLTNNVSSGMHITFAPLPSPEPRRRRSASQLRLGIAARGTLMRQRQLAAMNLNNTDQEGTSVLEQIQHKGYRVSASSERWQDHAFSKGKGRGREPDDPLLAMGRLMKSAWKRVSSPQAPKKGRLAPSDGGCRPEASSSTLEEQFPEGDPVVEREKLLHNHVDSQTDDVVEEEELGEFGDGDGDGGLSTLAVNVKMPKLNYRSSEAADTATAKTKAIAVSREE